MAKGAYKREHLTGLSFRVLKSMMAEQRYEEQLRAHIVIHKHEAEKAYRECSKSNKATPPNSSQISPPTEDQLVKSINSWGPFSFTNTIFSLGV